MDTTAIGQAAATLMEKVAEEFGEEAKIEAALVVVDVSHSDGAFTAVRHCARDGEGRWLSVAHAAGLAAMAQQLMVTPAPDDDE